MKTPLLRSIPAAMALALLIVLGAASTLWWQQRPATAAPSAGPAPVPVAVARVEQRDVPQLTRAIGTAQSIHNVTLRSQVDGVLTHVLFEEGQRVDKGDLLARIDDRSIRAALEQARAEKARNEAELRAAEIDLERYRKLVAMNAISRQEYDRQTALVAQLEATRGANQAAIAAAEVQLTHTRITSPVRGRVGIRQVDVGNVVRAGDAEGLVTVTQIEPIEVVFSLSQALLPRLRPIVGSAAPVRVYDQAGGSLLGEGALTTIDNQVDRGTGTIRLKARLPNADGALWPGQSVAVQLRLGVSADALVVPVTAVRHGLEGRYVFRVLDGKAEATPVRVAFEDDEIAVIAEGVAAGEIVVTDGHSRLKAGAPVKAVETAAPGA